LADTNWTLAPIVSTFGLTPPTITACTITAKPTGSTDPEKTRYMYVVTAVGEDGTESLPSVPFISDPGINVAVTQGTVSVFWNSIPTAIYYRVYKSLSTNNDVRPSYAEQVGFVGVSYGTQFTDSNIVPDFTLSPPDATDPFAPSQLTGYTITASSSDWPVDSTTIAVTDGTGSGAVIYPVLNNNVAGGVGAITGLFIARRGSGYTAPTLSALGGGTTFTATLTRSPASGGNPAVVGLFQQRQVYASSLNQPNTLWASRPGHFNDFRTNNPVIDSDAYTFTLASQKVDDIVWLQSMPGGLVIATNSGIVQLTGGGGSAGSTAAVTPDSAIVVPQAFNGASEIPPIVIDHDILYVQSQGAVVRDLQYQFYLNMYAGTDITILSSHLFYPLAITSWAYQDTPYKVIWAVQGNGRLLSLTWIKAQEVMGWAQHDTIGVVEDVEVVREGADDAVYLVVDRGGGGLRYIERMTTRIYNQVDDAWCLDCALSAPVNYPAANAAVSGSTGYVTIVTDADVFTAGWVGGVIRSVSSKMVIQAVIGPREVRGTVLYPFGNLSLPQGGWRLDGIVSAVTGLEHLNGFSVYALADGVVQGPFTVVAGGITLSASATQVVVGLPFVAQIQPLYLDVAGEASTQGRLKKVTAATVRVTDTARLKFGSSFANLREFEPTRSTDSPDPYAGGAGLYRGNMRAYVSPIFDRVGGVCIAQELPLPATILAIIPEVAQGDAM
jgi:hypothetical protein